MKVLLLFFFVGLITINAQDTTVYDMSRYVDQKPRWNGCDSLVDEKQAEDCWMEKYLDFLNENLIYPSTCEHFTGKLFIEFIVELNGSMKNIKILKGDKGSLDDEVLRVFKLFPDFIPAKLNGGSVRFRYRIPVTICLK